MPYADTPYRQGEPPPKTGRPQYRYDGGPRAPIPMPQVDPSKTDVPGKGGVGDGRIVKINGSSTLAYPAYGANRKNTSATQEVQTVRQTGN
jgi:hypothetical protein